MFLQPANIAEKSLHVKKEVQGLAGRNLHRAKKKPPKGMHLNSDDVTAMSSSGPAAVSVLRQLDMELIAIKRQVRVSLLLSNITFISVFYIFETLG